MSRSEKAKLGEEKLAKRLWVEKLLLEQTIAHLRHRGTGNFSLYADKATSGPIKARRRRQTSAPRFPRNRAEDTILNW